MCVYRSVRLYTVRLNSVLSVVVSLSLSPIQFPLRCYPCSHLSIYINSLYHHFCHNIIQYNNIIVNIVFLYLIKFILHYNIAGLLLCNNINVHMPTTT